jgi:glutaminyl-peptide cyclotransferase
MRVLVAAAMAAVSLAFAGCGDREELTFQGTAGAVAGAAAAPHVPARGKFSRFDTPKAWELIKLQLRYGQRPAGSPQIRRMAAVLRPKLPGGRFEPIPGHPGLRNIVGSLPGTEPAILIAAHYDTLAAPEGFVGANNGAAGSAIVIQLARDLAKLTRPPGSPALRFVLFDGEEPPKVLPEETPDFYSVGLRGSKAYVKAHRREIRELVLLDYVAGKGLRLPREATSSRSLWRRIRSAARAAGFGVVFPPRTGPSVTDDHTPFLRAGVPAVDLIDWSYPGHSLEDGIDLLSKRSVEAVGETLLTYLVRARARP